MLTSNPSRTMKLGGASGFLSFSGTSAVQLVKSLPLNKEIESPANENEDRRKSAIRNRTNIASLYGNRGFQAIPPQRPTKPGSVRRLSRRVVGALFSALCAVSGNT